MSYKFNQNENGLFNQNEKSRNDNFFWFNDMLLFLTYQSVTVPLEQGIPLTKCLIENLRQGLAVVRTGPRQFLPDVTHNRLLLTVRSVRKLYYDSKGFGYNLI